jgi:excisionase family DNA binding protein
MALNHLLKLDKSQIDDQGFISPARAAKLLDVQPQTVRKMVTQRKIRGYKVGKLVRIKAKDFLNYIDINAMRI